ncbi:MAG: hypothetical protein N2490_03205 [Ignavibacteria bacterium]|nr:hypothetical protein [Ignavibacteria bacterium]
MNYKTLIFIFILLISGCIFAQSAILPDFESVLNSKVGIPYDNLVPANPEKFTVRFTCSFVKLTWIPNKNDDPVIIAYNSVNKFGTLTDGKEYEVGDILPDGAKIVYIGTCEHFRHFNPPSENCYYKIWSFNKNFIYSSGIQATCIDESLINSVINFITN